MARFLSPDWLSALDAAVRAHPRLAELTSDVRIVVEQRVTGAAGSAVTEGGGDLDPGGPGESSGDSPGDVVYHVVLDHGSGSVHAGPAAEPTVTFTQSAELARAIATGDESAQRAFMAGHLRVGGDLQALAAHQSVVVELGDVFASVRSSTDFGPTGGAGAVETR